MLLLGPIAFQDFELPEKITFGGRQSMAVHRLPGGSRVIDVMGRDDADLRWSGVFSGPSAGDRARALDLMRADGDPLTLVWDVFCYTVIINRFEAEYTRSSWIPYRIECTVQADESAQPETLAISLAALSVSDAASAIGYDATVNDLTTALAAPDAATAGTQAHTAALASLAADSANLDARVAVAEASMQPPSDAPALASLVDTAGGLAATVTARSYVARAATNLGNAST